MGKVVISVLTKLVNGICESVCQGLWDMTWTEIKNGVVDAEKKWIETTENGSVKKDFVKEKVMTFIKSKAKLSWTQEQIVLMFLNVVINSIVKEINDNVGKDWGTKVDELKEYLAGILPFVK
jgi:hypothetical protein